MARVNFGDVIHVDGKAYRIGEDQAEVINKWLEILEKEPNHPGTETQLLDISSSVPELRRPGATFPISKIVRDTAEWKRANSVKPSEREFWSKF